MPRYFFNVHYDHVYLDDEGLQLPDDDAAWREAAITSGELIRELGDRLRPGRQWRLEVKTEVGELVYVIWLTGHRAQLPSEDVPP